MQIIDATLCMLENSSPTQKQVREWIRLMEACGIYDFMVSKKVYPMIEAIPDSTGVFYMEVDFMDNRKRYPRITYFMQSKRVQENTITMIQMNDNREIMHLRKFASAEAVALIGLDDFMCFDFSTSLKEIFSVFDKKKIYFSPENGNECATAEAVMFMKAGGKKVITAFAGIGKKAATEQVMLALRLNHRYKVNQDFSSLPQLKRLYEEITGVKIPEKMPVIGDHIFMVESGIHVDGIRKKPSNYETYPPELVGQTRKIVLGKQSGLSSIRYKLEEIGYQELEAEVCYRILKAVKKECSLKCKSLSDEELIRIIEGCL